VRSVALTGDLAFYDLLLNGWNHFATPDNTDTPSGLYEQLRWFEQAGLVDVDCFWLWAGHAIYGGFKP
jgi:tRNA (cmo5U34)-methyltransferase